VWQAVNVLSSKRETGVAGVGLDGPTWTQIQSACQTHFSALQGDCMHPTAARGQRGAVQQGSPPGLRGAGAIDGLKASRARPGWGGTRMPGMHVQGAKASIGYPAQQRLEAQGWAASGKAAHKGDVTRGCEWLHTRGQKRKTQAIPQMPQGPRKNLCCHSSVPSLCYLSVPPSPVVVPTGAIPKGARGSDVVADITSRCAILDVRVGYAMLCFCGDFPRE